VRQKHGPLRADILRQSMNAARLITVVDFISDYRQLAVQVGPVPWRLFFESGGTNKYAPAKHLNGLCGAAPVQMASYQVQAQIDRWLSNRANEFVDCLRRPKLADATKAQLYAINRKAAWFSRDEIEGIGHHRMHSGGKPPDSQGYRSLVTRVRGMLKTRINAALNSIVRIHAPAALVVERLDFRFPGLSRRMNRLISKCSRAVFRAKLVDLKDKFGIAATEVAVPYTSQECSSCHYVDKTNRPSQTKFACRWCDNASHPEVDASRIVNQRCSLELGTKWLTKRAILAVLVSQRIERWPLIRSNGPQGATHDPRLSNPYVKSWADLARNALETQGVMPCA
jgi:hypothetical protein